MSFAAISKSGNSDSSPELTTFLTLMRSMSERINEMNFKRQLRAYLAERHITASHLSKISGVPKQSISDWLAGASPRDLTQVKRIADIFGVTLDHLLFGDGIALDRHAVQEFGSLLGEDWVGGTFEVRVRRVKK